MHIRVEKPSLPKPRSCFYHKIGTPFQKETGTITGCRNNVGNYLYYEGLDNSMDWQETALYAKSNSGKTHRKADIKQEGVASLGRVTNSPPLTSPHHTRLRTW